MVKSNEITLSASDAPDTAVEVLAGGKGYKVKPKTSNAIKVLLTIPTEKPKLTQLRFDVKNIKTVKIIILAKDQTHNENIYVTYKHPAESNTVNIPFSPEVDATLIVFELHPLSFDAIEMKSLEALVSNCHHSCKFYIMLSILLCYDGVFPFLLQKEPR